MSRLNARQTAVFAAIVVFAVTGAILATRAESKPADRSAVIAGTDTTEAKSHGPCRPATGDRTVREDCRQGCASAHSRPTGRIQRLYLYAGESERDRQTADVR